MNAAGALICYGRVIRGEGLGRKLGYPTANIDIQDRSFPPRGVYAVKVYGAGLRGRLGAANVGVCPTVSGEKKTTLEVHIPGISKSLYGKILELYFIKRLRGEKKFPSVSALRAQIGRDIEKAIKLKVSAGFGRIPNQRKTSPRSERLKSRPKKVGSRRRRFRRLE